MLDASGRIEASTSSRGIIGSYYALHAPPVPGSVSFSNPFLSELSGAVVVEAAYSNGHKTVVALLDLGEISSKLVRIYYAGSRPVIGTDWRLLYLLDAETADAPMTAFMRSIAILVVAAIGGILALCFFARQNISTPLSALVSRIGLIADGSYSDRIGRQLSSSYRSSASTKAGRSSSMQSFSPPPEEGGAASSRSIVSPPGRFETSSFM